MGVWYWVWLELDFLCPMEVTLWRSGRLVSIALGHSQYGLTHLILGHSTHLCRLPGDPEPARLEPGC